MVTNRQVLGSAPIVFSKGATEQSMDVELTLHKVCKEPKEVRMCSSYKCVYRLIDRNTNKEKVYAPPWEIM